MLVYHPALDPHHGAFRLVRLLVAEPDKVFHRSALQILDFYLLFPELIGTIRLPRAGMRYKRVFDDRANRYWFKDDPGVAFRKMSPIQEHGLRLLEAKGIVEERGHGRSQVALSALGRQTELAARAASANAEEKDLMDCLVKVLAALPLLGPDGLKARSQLMEYRYDAA